VKLLLSNDDGIHAQGLKALYQQLTTLSDDITVVAPDRNCSGISHGLTLLNPLRATHTEEGFISINGTPADCVNVGIDHLAGAKPDYVIAGINHGPNLGQDVIHSGTVAAAMAGRFLGVPSLAVSLTGRDLRYYDTAAKVVAILLTQLPRLLPSSDQILNVNVPNVPMDELKGIKVTTLGRRHRPENMGAEHDPWGRDIYWYGKLSPPVEDLALTDFNAIADNYVSVTPLTVDMTATQAMKPLTQWINEVKLS
jgi:5'-nucleotidase